MNNNYFEEIINLVFQEEGDYENNPDDPGGETKYGISKRNYPNLNIKDLTKEQATEIYHRDYWNKFRFDDIENLKIATKLFTLTINIGHFWAIHLLQRALRAAGNNIKEDGFIGEKTLFATNQTIPSILLATLKSEEAGYYRTIAALHPLQKEFLNGWLNRAYL